MEILRVLVGSRAHGLALPESDRDYRAVYVTPTSKFLELGAKVKGTSWIEGEAEDNVAYEVGHFLNLAMYSNPTVLEMFVAPTYGAVRGNAWELRALFPYVWSSERVYEAFGGYADNQRKKMMDDRTAEHRRRKFGVAWLRVLWQGYRLLTDEVLPIDMTEEDVYAQLVSVRDGQMSWGAVVDMAAELQAMFHQAYFRLPLKHEADPDKVNEYLLRLRKEHWDA